MAIRSRCLPRLRGGYVFVEGSSVGDVSWPVLRDRERLAQGGVFFAVVPVNSKGDLIGTPEFVTSGFVARGEAEEMEEGAQSTNYPNGHAPLPAHESNLYKEIENRWNGIYMKKRDAGRSFTLWPSRDWSNCYW
jgi:mRNA degradation ribonuclease J1/J2